MVMRETRARGVLATKSGMHKLQNAKTTQSNGKGKPLTYTDIAEIVGINEKTVERFFLQEQAIDESSARAICQALNVNANEVIDWIAWDELEDRNGYLSNFHEFKTDTAITLNTSKTSLDNRKSRLVQEITQNQGQDFYMFLAGDMIDGSDVKLTRVNFNDEDLSHVDLSYANLCFAKLSRADLSHTNLSHANISHGDLSGAKLTCANFSGADLTHANLTFANLSGAELSGSHLSGAYLGHANLSHAKLSGTNLVFADLSGADLSNVDFSDANVENARFGNNPGILESIKNNLIQRGAIFEDSPGDHSQILIPR